MGVDLPTGIIINITFTSRSIKRLSKYDLMPELFESYVTRFAYLSKGRLSFEELRVCRVVRGVKLWINKYSTLRNRLKRRWSLVRESQANKQLQGKFKKGEVGFF